jgi:ABC-type phosphate transport system permease subunit
LHWSWYFSRFVQQVFLFSHTKLQVNSLPDNLPHSPDVDGGTLAGAVIGTLVVLVLVATVAVVLLVIISRKMHKRKQLERMQLDICAL